MPAAREGVRDAERRGREKRSKREKYILVE